MRFDIDVLILYADSDNEANAKNEPGWVTQFKKFLELMLTQILGEKPNVVLKAEHDNIVSPKLDNAATLITTLSKDFIQSGQCLDHLEAFYKATENGPALPRIFKVFKSPLGILEQPPRLRELLGYEMYQIDPDSGEIREYTDYFSTDAERQYWMKMVDLTYDIYDALLVIRGTNKQTESINYKRKTIYLAETGHDLSVQRNIIKRELQRHGYHVLPNQTLPGTASELERIVRRDLEKSNLSIHLIGSAYGEIPEGSEKSVVDLQNKLSAERTIQAKSAKQEFSRLIWIPTNILHASERQKAFIESIKRDVEAQEGAEILQTSLEDFKNIMREELMEAVEKTAAFTDSAGKSVYVMHDKIDHTEVKPFIQFIKDSGFEVLVPEFEGELLELRQKHIENLRKLDAAIIYKGKVNEQWVRMKALDLLKAPGFGRKKPIIAKAILTTPGSGVNAESFRTQNLRVFEGDQQRSLESLKSFLQEFNA
jgi:hypothetical protein